MLGGGAPAPPRRVPTPPWPNDVGRGGAAPPHPPYWPAVGRREILERFAIRSPNLNNDNNNNGRGGAAPPAPPLLAGLRPAGNSRALRHSAPLI